MKNLCLTVIIAALLAFLPCIASADENSAVNWRTRVSLEGSDSYARSDIEEELSFGREISARLLGQYRISADEKKQKYINLVGKTLAQNCNRPELDFHFIVVDSDEINAYSTPGGYVFVTTAVIKVMENEAELAGVLAHEIAHITLRHIVKELNLRGAERSATASLATLIGGATETAGVAFSQAVDKAVDLILRDGYKKEDEMQADATAVLLCAFSGYDPSGLVTFLEKVAKVKSGVGKTYPVYDIRLATLQAAMKDEGIEGIDLALNTERFNATITKSNNSTAPLNTIRKMIKGVKP